MERVLRVVCIQFDLSSIRVIESQLYLLNKYLMKYFILSSITSVECSKYGILSQAKYLLFNHF